MFKQALKYAARGWLLFPIHAINAKGCCGCRSGRKCRTPGKHPITKNGHKDATTEEEKILEWSAKFPDANIGIRTGSESGVIVLDIDPRHDGGTSLAHLEGKFGNLPATLEVLTVGGGRHLYYRHPGGIVRNKASIAPGIDLRADGGYVVAPPSNHISGSAYSWKNNADTAELPGWLLRLITNDVSFPTYEKLKPSPSDPIVEGRRNTTLASIAGSLRRQGFPKEEINFHLRAINQGKCRPPLDDVEVGRIAASVASYEPGPNTPNLTDLGNASRLVACHGQELQYCHAWKKWLIWSGTHWKADDTGKIVQLAKDIVQRLHLEAIEAQDAKLKVKLAKWALQSESGVRIREMIRLAPSETGIPVTPDDLDADHWTLNVPNGTLDLPSGELRPPRREDLCTKLIPIPFHPKSECPRWQKFLADVTCGKQDLAQFLQRAVGYTLTGSTKEQVIFILHGTAANGKTTFVELIRKLLGGYALTADASTFLARPYDGVRNDLARLRAARFVSAQEVGEGRRLDESLAKQVTGGDAVTARYLYAEFFEFVPQLKLFLATNHKPEIRGTDNAIWRRIRLVPFTRIFASEEQDKDMLRKLKGEMQGTLAWAVEGCLAWQRNGLDEPEAVVEATRDYRKEMDEVGEFITECCVLHKNAWVSSENLYREYQDWCRSNGSEPMKKTRLGIRLGERGLSSNRITAGANRGKNRWNGIGLTDSRAKEESDKLKFE